MRITKKDLYEPPREPRSVRSERATVAGFDSEGEPLLRFAGEQMASPKIYPRLKHYMPEAGERVLLIDDIIIGGVARRADQNI